MANAQITSLKEKMSSIKIIDNSCLFNDNNNNGSDQNELNEESHVSQKYQINFDS